MNDREKIIEALKVYYFNLLNERNLDVIPTEMIQLAIFLLNNGASDSPSKDMDNERAINIVIDDTQLDRVIEKANNLKQTLLEAKDLGCSFGSDMEQGLVKRLDSKLSALLKLKMLTIDFGSVSKGYCRDKSLEILNEYVSPEEAESLKNKY